MTLPRARPIRDVLALHRDEWDRDGTRPAAREAFAKAVDCGTEALGAEVFASAGEERVVYHTCKSRACPSCGHQATRAWQRDQWRELPDVPYAHVCLTMPDVLWPLFQRNRHLLHDLPVLGAQVLQQWARAEVRHSADDRDHPAYVRPTSEFQLPLAHPGVPRRSPRGWHTMVRPSPAGPEGADADVALRRHHVAAGSGTGRRARDRLGSWRVAAIAHRPVRTVVEHRRQAVPQQEAVPGVRGPICQTAAHRAAPVPDDQPSRNPVCDERTRARNAPSRPRTRRRSSCPRSPITCPTATGTTFVTSVCSRLV